ncbi:MAG: hypothetical protein WCS73_05700 [Lentisphaeria bacterium]
MSDIEALAPKGYGNIDSEPFKEYEERIKPYLPNIPSCVLEQFFHRHWNDVLSTWSWIGLKELKFEKLTWKTEKVLEFIKSHQEDLIDSYEKQFETSSMFQSSWLGSYMLTNGTWPSPIIVLHNENNIKFPNGIPLQEPYSLMEGHHRLAYFRFIKKNHPSIIQGVHSLWLATPNTDKILKTWKA